MGDYLLLLVLLGLGIKFLTVGQWVALGGLSLIVCGHEFGHWFTARLFKIKVSTFSIGFGSPSFKFGRIWGTDFQITPWLIGGYVDINPNSEEFLEHAAWKRACVLVAGVTMNLIMAVVFLIAAYGILGKPTPQLTVAHLVSADAPAAIAGVHEGDYLISIDGVAISDPQVMIDQVQKHQDGKPATLVLVRDGHPVNVLVTPVNGKVGIQFGQVLTYKHVGPVQAVAEGLDSTKFIVVQTAKGIGMQFGWATPPPGVDTHLHSIVGIVQMGGSAYQQGIFSFVWMLAALNIALLFMNILPLGVLDGGHLAYIGWEKLTGRRVPMKVQNVIAVTSLVLIGALLLYGLYNDYMFPVPH